MQVNGAQYRWLEGLLRDQPGLAAKVTPRMLELGRSAKAEFDRLTAQMSRTSDPVDSAILAINRNAARRTIAEVHDVLEVVKQYAA